MPNFYLVIIILFLSGLNSFAVIPEFLKRWEVSPSKASLEIPLKSGSLRPSKFTKSDMENRNFVGFKDKVRMKLCNLANKNHCEEGF